MNLKKISRFLICVLPIFAWSHPIDSWAFSKGKANRYEGILKVKYNSNGKKYKACCQGYGGLGPCSEEGSLYTISYDIHHSEPGDPCTYADMYVTPSPTPGPKKAFESTVD